ncbi:MAG: hypothetical protein AAGD01_17010 [Acidobacteriota bacterium]
MLHFNLQSIALRGFAVACLSTLVAAGSLFAAPQDGKKDQRAPRVVTSVDVEKASAEELIELTGRAFKRLQQLEGTWVASYPGFEKAAPVEVTYRNIGRGSAVVETFRPGLQNETQTIYVRTRNGLRANHVCAYGTQPVMQLFGSAKGGDLFVFQEAGGTNLDVLGDETRRMRLESLEFPSEDRVVAVWSTFEGEKALGPPTPVVLTRKSSGAPTE